MPPTYANTVSVKKTHCEWWDAVREIYHSRRTVWIGYPGFRFSRRRHRYRSCRWAPVQVPLAGLWTSLHSTVEFAAASAESRRASRAGEEPTVPLQHLRQRICDGVQSTDAHIEGQSCMYCEFFLFSFFLVFIIFPFLRWLLLINVLIFIIRGRFSIT